MNNKILIFGIAVLTQFGCGREQVAPPRALLAVGEQREKAIDIPLVQINDHKPKYVTEEPIKFSVHVDYLSEDTPPIMVILQVAKGKKIVDTICPLPTSESNGRHIYTGEINAPNARGRFRIVAKAIYDGGEAPLQDHAVKNLTSKPVDIDVR